MKKIFVDMDGVITDFNKKYTEMFGRTPAEVRMDRERKQYSEFWHLFVDRFGFVGVMFRLPLKAQRQVQARHQSLSFGKSLV